MSNGILKQHLHAQKAGISSICKVDVTQFNSNLNLHVSRGFSVIIL